MQGVAFFLENSGGRVIPSLIEYYGTVTSTMMTLFMAISGGMDWGDLVKPLLEISRWYYAVYVFFLLFVLFGIMNILTAIFCESANQIAFIDRDLVIQEELDNDESTVNELRRLLQEFDVDESRTLTSDEFDQLMKDKRTLVHFRTLGLHLNEANGLFTLLDRSQSGEVPIDEFVNTLMRLKGNSQAIDLATIMYENKRITSQMMQPMRYVQTQFELITSHLEIGCTGEAADQALQGGLHL